MITRLSLSIVSLAWSASLAIPARAEVPRIAPQVMRDVAPDLAGYTDEVLFARVWNNPALAKSDHSLLTVTALVATGRTGPLEGHMARALDNGVSPRALSGLVTQVAFYGGWPSAVGALPALHDLFEKRGISTTDWPGGASARLPLVKDDPQRLGLATQSFVSAAPDLAKLTDEVLFEDLWRHTDLAPRERSLVTIAALVAEGMGDQLPFHLRLGMRNGLTREELGAAMEHLAFYVGWPKAMQGAAVLQDLEAHAAPKDAGVPQDAEGRIFVPGVTPQGGAAPRFTGDVEVTSPFRTEQGTQLGGATVTFQPGARTVWHVHPTGQLLVIARGEGRVQLANAPVRKVLPGDVVWTPAGVAHWHGAAPGVAMAHVAISERNAGAGEVAWGEPVDDVTYRTAPAARVER